MNVFSTTGGRSARGQSWTRHGQGGWRVRGRRSAGRSPLRRGSDWTRCTGVVDSLVSLYLETDGRQGVHDKRVNDWWLEGPPRTHVTRAEAVGLCVMGKGDPLRSCHARPVLSPRPRPPLTRVDVQFTEVTLAVVNHGVYCCTSRYRSSPRSFNLDPNLKERRDPDVCSQDFRAT